MTSENVFTFMFDSSSSFSNQQISINEVTKYGYSPFDGNKGVDIRILKKQTNKPT